MAGSVHPSGMCGRGGGGGWESKSEVTFGDKLGREIGLAVVKCFVLSQAQIPSGPHEEQTGGNLNLVRGMVQLRVTGMLPIPCSASQATSFPQKLLLPGIPRFPSLCSQGPRWE